jgi:PST family polysaccharide transporter
LSPKLFKNYLSLASGEIFGKLLIFSAYGYLARILGPADFGAIEWAGAAVMCAGLLVDQGLSSYGAREIAINSSDTVQLAGEVITARSIFAVISYFLIILLASEFSPAPIVYSLLLIFGLELLALPFLLNWVFQGHDRMTAVAAAGLIRQLIFTVTVFVLVRSGNDILSVGWAEALSVAVAALFTLLMFRNSFSPLSDLRPRFSAKLLREGLPIGLSQMFWVVKMFGATLIVGIIGTPTETGFFASAMRILIALHAFIWLYYMNLLPSLARAWQSGRETFAALIGNSMRLVILLTVVLVAVWIALSPLAVKIVYGDKFAEASTTLQWLAGVFLLAAVSGHYRFGLIAAGRQNEELLTAALGAILTVIFLPLGFYRYGAAGAAAGLCAAEFGVLVSSWLFARRLLFFTKNTAEASFETLPQTIR